VHNEYLHQLIDHGLPGLLSQIAFLFGLLYTTLQLRRIGSGTAAMALGGILLMYAVGSLSNVNFAHNYFSAGLSLMTGLSIGLLGPPRSPERFSNQH
jgi:O-antigen ligase